MRLVLLVGSILILGLFQNAPSFPVSSQIAYQGILTDGAGNPLKDTVYTLEFSLHTDSVGNNPVWTETKAVSTKGGVFSHMLGSVISLEALKFDMQYWLGIKRGGNEVGQKIRLGVAPYARRAMVADSAGKVDGRNVVANSIDSAKIANNAVTTNEILNGTIRSEDVRTDFQAPLSALSDSAKWIRASAITTGMIKTEMIADASISSDKVKSNAITAGKISSASVNDSNIVNVSWSKPTGIPLLSQSTSSKWNGTIVNPWTAICIINLKANQGDVFKISFHSLNPSNTNWIIYYWNSSDHTAFASVVGSTYEGIYRLPDGIDGFLV